MIVPLFALIFLTIDTAWGIFVKSTIQSAVQQGVRYAITGQTGANGQIAAIESIVVTQAMGLLSASDLYVHFIDSATQADLGQTAGANQAGNVVEIDATYSFNPLAPLFRSGASIPLSAKAADILEGFPGGVAPSL